MNKMTIGAIAVVALLGVGAAAAQFGGFGRVDEYCSDDQTVGECKQAIRAARAEEKQERCLEQYDEAFCAELHALKGEHHNETASLLDEYGIEGKPQFRPARPDRSEPVCTDDMSVEACRTAHQEARREAALAACTEVYGADFCEAWFALKDEHKAETEALFDEYGYEPSPNPGGRGPGRHR